MTCLTCETHSAEDRPLGEPENGREHMGTGNRGKVEASLCRQEFFLDALGGSMIWKEAVCIFTVSPLMISCWVCLFSQVKKEEHQKVFKSASTHFWQIAVQLSEKHSGVQPNLRSIAVEALERHKNKQ